MRFYNVDESEFKAQKYRAYLVIATGLLIASIVLNLTVLAHCQRPMANKTSNKNRKKKNPFKAKEDYE